MDRLSSYLTVVPLPVLIAIALAAGAAFVMVPNRWRLPLALIALPSWMTLGQLPELPSVQAIAKATGVIAYGCVMIAAILTPGPKRRIPGIVWLYPAMAIVGLIYLPTLTDGLFAMVLQIQFFVLSLAAIFTARTIVDEASLLRVVMPLSVGAAIAMVIPASALVLNPGEAFAGGLGRFRPYGANQNQVGVVFVLAMPLALYAAYRCRPLVIKAGFVAVAAAAVGLGLITASRSVVFVMAIASAPLGVLLLRRPALAAIVACVGLAVVGYLVSQPEEIDYERLQTLETGRVEIGIEYLRKIAERPVFGLMGSSGMSALSDESIGHHPHNVYLEMLYVGGLSYFVPLMTVMGYGGLCAVRVYFRRRSFEIDPVLVATLCAFLVGMYAHGFVNGAILYPTYTWSWWHVTLSAIMIALAHDLSAAKRDPVLVTYDEEYAESGAMYDPASEDWEYHDRPRPTS
jgi:hypothetical protein